MAVSGPKNAAAFMQRLRERKALPVHANTVEKRVRASPIFM
jgi:hypothetical protein